MGRLTICATVLVGLSILGIGSADAAVVTRVEVRPHSDSGINISQPVAPFSTVANLSASDYADAASGNGATAAVVAGAAFTASGPPTKVLDGLWPWDGDLDAPSQLLFSNDLPFAFQLDLQALISVEQVNVYTRHNGNRTPAAYDLYGSASAVAPSTDGTTAGWTSIANVDSTTGNLPDNTGTSYNGIAGISTFNDAGRLGNFQHLLFVATRSATFYGEVDVVGQAISKGIDLDFSSVMNADVVVNNGGGGGGGTDTVQDGTDSYSLMTQSAAVALSGGDPNGLPDDGLFLKSANAALPFDVQLAYSNSDDGTNALKITGNGESTLTLSAEDKGKYNSLYLYAHSGAGDSEMTVTLSYQTGADTTVSGKVPDWFDDDTPGSGELAFVDHYLIDALDRIKNNATGYDERNDPAIFGFDLDPDPTRVLTSIKIDQTAGGNLIVFGASGQLIPEPATLSLLVLGALGVLARRRRA